MRKVQLGAVGPFLEPYTGYVLYGSGLERDFLGQDDRDRVGKRKRVTRGLLRAAKLTAIAK